MFSSLLLLALLPPQRGELVTLPFARGETIFTSRGAADGGVDFCVQKGLTGAPRVLISSADAPLNKEIPLNDIAVSDDGKMCLYFVTQDDNRYEAICVVETATGKRLPDTIQWTHFGDFGWEGRGFYYGAYPPPTGDSKTRGPERVYYHRLGQPQASDKVVLENPEHPDCRHQFLSSFDHKFFIMHLLERKNGQLLSSEWFHRSGDPVGKFTPIQGEMAPGRFFLCDDSGDHLVYYTAYKSPGGRIIDVDTRQPDESHWKTLVPEPVIDGEPVLGMLAVLVKGPTSRNSIKFLTFGGAFVKEIRLPTGNPIDMQSARATEHYAFFASEDGGKKSYWALDARSGTMSPIR